MPERISILKALQQSGSSKLIQRLNPDQTVPSIAKAIELIETHQLTDPQRITAFHTPRFVSPGSHFSFTTPFQRPHYKPLLVATDTLRDEFQLDPTTDPNLTKILSGAKVYYTDTIFPYSLAYAGYQFGSFAGQLGDGRVHNLFSLNNQVFQLKGSGITPFSRFADGKALLRSSIREFIISGALHAMNVPSTRALQLTLLPGTRALREGGRREPCAVVCRVAPSWIRLGSFDMFKWRPHLPGLVKLTDYCIDEVFQSGKDFPRELNWNRFDRDYFPDEEGQASASCSLPLDDVSQYDLFFRHVVNLNANTVAFWQASLWVL